MATLIKRSGRKHWIIQYFDADGRRRERSSRTTDKRAAERLASKLDDEARQVKSGLIDRQEHLLGQSLRRSVEDHLDDYLACCRLAEQSDLNIDNKARHLRALFRHSRLETLDQLDADALEKYLASIEEAGRSERTINLGRESAIACVN